MIGSYSRLSGFTVLAKRRLERFELEGDCLATPNLTDQIANDVIGVALLHSGFETPGEGVKIIGAFLPDRTNTARRFFC